MSRVKRAVIGRVRRATARFPSRSSGPASESGNAIVEFLGITVILLIPLVYLVLVLAKIQGATFAAQGAAKDVGRAYVLSESIDDAELRASLAFELALANQGFAADEGTLSLTCGQADCLAAGGTISAVVTVPVSLPGVPGVVRDVVPVAIPVSATHLTVIDQLRAD